MAIVVMLLLVGSILALFLPVSPFEVTESHRVSGPVDVSAIAVDLTSDIVDVNIAFEDLGSKAFTMDVTLSGLLPLLSPIPDLKTHFWHEADGGVLYVASEIVVKPQMGGLSGSCDIIINPSLNVTLHVEADAGRVILDAGDGVVLNSVYLVSVSGGVEVNLAPGAALVYGARFEAISGDVDITWDGVEVIYELSPWVWTASGNIALSITQETLGGNVSFDVETSKGSIDLDMDIRDNVGAIIESCPPASSVTVERQDGFMGSELLLFSINHPSGTDFDIYLRSTLGRIRLNVAHIP